MKKIMFSMLVVLSALMIFSCGSSNGNSGGLPEFVMNPPLSDDYFYGVGYGDKGRDDLSIAAAKTNARADIARQIETVVQSSLEDYAQTAGVDGDTQTIEFFENVTRDITNQKLTGVQQVTMEKVRNGGYWVLMQYDKNLMVESAKESFARNENAAFAEFKASQALEKLDYQLKNNPTVSEPVE
ncbi:MAG: LPP20 family lipoprotein [Spirochaetales bacterium]|nr:LPP20 family lipoprotein [Spirochaetales bacterium]